MRLKEPHPGTGNNSPLATLNGTPGTQTGLTLHKSRVETLGVTQEDR